MEHSEQRPGILYFRHGLSGQPPLPISNFLFLRAIVRMVTFVALNPMNFIAQRIIGAMCAERDLTFRVSIDAVNYEASCFSPSGSAAIGI